MEKTIELFKIHDAKTIRKMDTNRERERESVYELEFRLRPLRSCHAMKPEFVTIPGHVRSK